MENTKKLKILFLCTGNSCRSQIAEGFTRQLKKAEVEARSAGIEPKGIDPRAIKTMAEVGIDISSQRSKSIDEIKDIEFDYVITLCDNAQKTCPSFPAKTSIIHVGFEDPPRLAENARDEEEAMQHYRRVRDQIKTFVEQLPDILTNKKPDIEFDPRQLLSGISTGLSQRSED